jgi:hypothetical protein
VIHVDVETYKWAVRCQDYLLETRIFQSTSEDLDVAKAFGSPDLTSKKLAVVITFTFVAKDSLCLVKDLFVDLRSLDDETFPQLPLSS